MPVNLSQGERLMTVTTPLGKDVLVLTGWSGEEHLGGLFSFRLDLVSTVADVPKVKFESLLGQPLTIEFDIFTPSGQKQHRILNGLCVRFFALSQDLSFAHWRAEIVPAAWFLTRRARSRIFQQRSVPTILQDTFKDYPDLKFQLKLHGSYEKREYCVQYGETDFNFVSRLLEEEGIFYFFTHANNEHTMIITDHGLGYPDVPGNKAAKFDAGGGGEREAMIVDSWQKGQEIRSGKYTLWDHSFHLPGKNLEAKKTVLDHLQVGKVAHKLKVAGNDQYELYEYPGHFAKRFDGIDLNGGDQAVELNKINQDNGRTTQLRIEAENTGAIRISGTSNCQNFSAGHKFTLKKHPDAEGDYIFSSVYHSATGGTSYRSGGDSQYRYSNSFECFPPGLPFRPARLTPHPLVNGVQTATVVGPAGEEIFTDKYGRVKVQFNWDREGQDDSRSSCWLRVATPWAGNKWGMIHIPRIGQEVLIDFLDGHPDAPIIVGSVYNPHNMPPYELPANKTQSGLRTRSTLGGGGQNSNEFRFEDKMGQEQIFLHAERNFDLRTKNDSFETIGHNRHLVVEKDQFESVKGDKHQEVTGEHNQKVGETLSITTGQNIQEKAALNVGLEAGTEIHLKAGMNVVIEAGASITIKAGGGFIVVGPSGVTISGTPVLINSGGAAGAGSGINPTPPQLALEAAKPGLSLATELTKPARQKPVHYGPAAQVLKEAAKNGTPFCEQCAKAAAAKAATA